MDALVKKLLDLAETWEHEADQVSRTEGWGGSVAAELNLRKCADEVRETLKQQKVGAWA